MIEFIKGLFKRNEKIEPPEESAIIKINDIAKENGIYDDENKIIEVNRSGKISKIKYSEAEVESLREQGIPVVEEVYSDEAEFIESVDFGGIESWKR
ncbi:MAG: hypothetical protein AABY22_03890 [Nanoarchaeota archaeon]